MHKNEKWIKLAGTVLCEIFTVCTIIMLLAVSEPDRLLLAFVTLLLAALPMLLEKLLHCRISLPVYIFALAYAIGPMLGHCWKLYYTVPVWDTPTRSKRVLRAKTTSIGSFRLPRSSPVSPPCV